MATGADRRGTLAIPQAQLSLPASSTDELDRAVATLRDRAKEWLHLAVADRVELLERMIADTRRVAGEWVAAAARAKRYPQGSPTEFEDWQGPFLTVRNLRLLRDSLRDIDTHGLPVPPGEPTTHPDGRVVVPVFPEIPHLRAVYDRMHGEIWMQPHVTLDDLHHHQARAYREPSSLTPRVCLVLGAGNVAAIPPTDALYKLFAELQTVVLKMNPVNDHLGGYLAQAMAALVERGFLRIVYGGADEGSYLAGHEGVDEVHVTGSDKTHDAIVFGTGEEGARRKSERRPLLTKRITSELGNVTPVIVVPGRWSDDDVLYHAHNIASMLTNNAGFNCIAAGNVVTHRMWSRRSDLLNALRATLREARSRYPYYPGSEDRWRAFVDAYPHAERLGPEGDGYLPWTLIPDLEPDVEEDIAFAAEAFSPVLGEVALDAPRDVATFIDQAVEFCNDRLWGTLAATVIVHPRSQKDPPVAGALDRALERLRYGTVAVNHWTGLAYAVMTTSWGAYTGHDLHDIQSGRGVVHNTYLYEAPEKSVVRGPFRTVVEPPWFVTHRRAHEVGRRYLDVEADPSLRTLTRLMPALLRP
ncbi:MAG TPA: aldehyde dehydrogenase family protein [Nitriliruptorales bacterium]|nr:aldehyde dehydrogenase family protein [Nitriliruptorales bacterium]